MKKYFPLLAIFCIVFIVVVVYISMLDKKQLVVIYEGNNTHQPVDIKLNHFQDSQCDMTIKKKEDSVQAISPDGRTWFFDDMGCFALWYKNVEFKDDAIVWVYSRDTKEYIDARKAWYVQNADTVMGYGFAAFKNKKDNMTSFDEVLLKMYLGENLKDPLIRKKLLGN